MKESDIEARLVKGVNALGGWAYKFTSPGNVGVPDRLVVLPGGYIIFVELNTETGRLSAMQEYQHFQLRKRGAVVWVVRGMDGVDKFLHYCRQLIHEEGGTE